MCSKTSCSRFWSLGMAPPYLSKVQSLRLLAAQEPRHPFDGCNQTPDSTLRRRYLHLGEFFFRPMEPLVSLRVVDHEIPPAVPDRTTAGDEQEKNYDHCNLQS